LIRNLDTRWEWYPQPGEVISLGVFAKFFDDPIERVFVFQAGGNPELSFANAASARNYGVEAEVRKSLALLAGGLRSFTVFANATVMHSRITPGSDSLSAATASERPMTGQSDYMVNAGLGYGNASGSVSATLLYNVVGRRISEAAPRPLPDTYEEARHQLDATLQVQPWTNWRVRLDGRNLLDSPYRFTQGDVLRLRYKSGRQVALGFGWNL
ncbi:MAG: TonB-dependent receptor domain-containing protein, partial [Gemmatimonadales bacterium]